jgi:hypothetical protein
VSSDDGDASDDNEASDDDEDSNAADQFTVQRIIEHTGAGSARRYFCVWDGFPDPSEYTWEPACNVAGVPAHVAYLQQLRA